MMRRPHHHHPLAAAKAGRAAVLVSALATALLTACAPLPPAVPDNAQVQLPGQWSTPAESSAAPVTAQWWQQLGDARLNTLVQKALANNT